MVASELGIRVIGVKFEAVSEGSIKYVFELGGKAMNAKLFFVCRGFEAKFTLLERNLPSFEVKTEANCADFNEIKREMGNNYLWRQRDRRLETSIFKGVSRVFHSRRQTFQLPN